MKWISKCHWDELFKDILTDMEYDFDERMDANDIMVFSLEDNVPEWLAEIWQSFTEIHAKLYDLHYTDPSDEILYNELLKDLDEKAKATILLLLMLVKDMKELRTQ